MPKNKNFKNPFLAKVQQNSNLFLFGTVFFATSVLLLVGMFLFPAVRTMLHASAIATGMVPGDVMTGEPLPEEIFKDVSNRHVNARAIAYLKDHGVVKGYPDGTFKPDHFVTRAELLKFLFEAQKVYPSTAVYRACFKDAQDEWYAPYVCYAKAKELVRGYADGTFGAGRDVAVVEALKIILLDYHAVLLESPPAETMIFDEGAWFAKYVWTAYAKELITWEKFVDPPQLPNLNRKNAATALLTRAHLAEILYRLMK